MHHDLKQRITAARTKTLIETNAQTVAENLEQLRARFDVHRSRWIWELLQNAADATDRTKKGNRVSIRIEPGRLIFRHDGSAFSLDNITHLIYHGSTKQDDEAKGGKFGTGFLTIHLISPKVGIGGILEDEGARQHFHFVLDRSGNTAAIRKNMEEAQENLESSLGIGSNEREFSTEFECELDPDAQNVVERSLAELERDIPYVLAVVSEFDEIKVEWPASEISWRRDKPQSLNSETVGEFPGVTVVDMVRKSVSRESIAELNQVRIAVVGDHQDNVAVAVCLRQIDGLWELAVDDATPRLFYPFPLVDTHELALPFVVISRQFQPREERDGIRASAEGLADELTQRNWALLGKIPLLFKTLVAFGVSAGWLAAHRLSKIRRPAVGKWLDAERFVSEVLREVLSFVRGQDSPSFVLTLDGTLRAPRDVVSPGRDVGGRIYSLVSRISALRNNLPATQIVAEWAAIGEGWESVLGGRFDELDEALTSEKLAVRIGSCNNLEDLSRSLINETREDALRWLNDLLASVPNDLLPKFTSTHAILPNQRDAFRRADTLRRDGEIEERIKDICDKLGDDVRSLLLLTGMSPQVSELFGKEGQTFTNEECVERARKRLCDLRIETNNASLVEASAALLSWIIEKGRSEKLAGFPVFCAEGCGELRDKSALLAPVTLWEAGAQEFAGLFGPARRLHDGYAAVLQEEHWCHLGERELVLRSLFTSENLEGLEPRQVEGELKDVEHLPIPSATIPQIVFFQEKGGVLDNVRGSKPKGKQLIRFLLKYVVTAPSAKADGCDVGCSCEQGAHHRVLPAWLSQLKTREWVYLARGKADRPTAENIAPLLDDELMQQLHTTHGRAFISRLGIGVIDLLRLRAPEEKRSQLEQIFGQMCASPDESTLASIATVLDDPNIRDAVLEKRETRDKVRKNQQLGAAVERLLRQELEGAGIQVTRTGRGSDFEVELESDFLDENEQEQLFEFSSEDRSYLLEVKSARSESVKMTLRQGEEATKNRERYALCVVDISGGEPDEQMVRDHSHFVCDIGARVELKVAAAKDLKDREQLLQQGGGEIAIAIDGSSVRLQIGAALWRNIEHSVSFEKFIEQVKQRGGENKARL